MGISTSQAKEIMNEFNNSPLQKRVSVTITNKSSGEKASTDFDFYLMRPNLLEMAVETLNPFSVVNGLGDAWTAVTTGNAYVDFVTTSSVLIDNGIVSPIRFSGKALTYMESLAISKESAFLLNWLPHQIDNAINAYINVLYLSGSGALVKVDLTPNFGVLGDYNVTIDGQEMTSANSKYSFTLRVGTLDQQIIEEANTTSVTPNQSSGSLTNNAAGTTTTNNSNGTTTTSNNAGTTTTSNSAGTTTTNNSTGTTPVNNNTGTYGQYSYPAITPNQHYQQDTSNTQEGSNKSDKTKYWMIGGAVALGVLALLMMKKK